MRKREGGLPNLPTWYLGYPFCEILTGLACDKILLGINLPIYPPKAYRKAKAGAGKWTKPLRVSRMVKK